MTLYSAILGSVGIIVGGVSGMFLTFATKSDISDIKTEITGVKNAVEDVKKDISGIQREIESVKKDTLVIQRDILNVKNDVDSVKKDISDLRKDISDLRKDMITSNNSFVETLHRIELEMIKHHQSGYQPDKNMKLY